MRVLTSHKCVMGFIPGPSVVCGLSLFLVLFLALWGFSPGTPVFTSSQKPTYISKFQFNLVYCQALYHDPLTRVIAQAFPAFDIKFTLILHFCIVMLSYCAWATWVFSEVKVWWTHWGLWNCMLNRLQLFKEKLWDCKQSSCDRMWHRSFWCHASEYREVMCLWWCQSIWMICQLLDPMPGE